MSSDDVHQGEPRSPEVAASGTSPGIAATAVDNSSGSAARPAPLLALSAMAGVLALLSWFVTFENEQIVTLLNEYVGLGTAIGIHVLLLCFVAAAGVFVSNIAWRHPARRRASGAAGLVFVFSVVSVIFQIANAGSFAIFSRDNYLITAAMDVSENAEITVLDNNHVRIYGEIGPNLMRDFMTLEQSSGPFLGLEINSPGGFIDQALKLARLVEDRRIPVTVREECLSACVLVAVASPASYAEEGAIFGFHRGSAVAEVTSEIAIFGVTEADKEANGFMEEHGVPQEVLREASNYGPDSMYFLTASEMVESGMIEGIASE